MILRKNKSDCVENSVVSSFFGKLQQKTQSVVRSTLKNARALLAIGMIAGGANALEQEDHASSQKQSPSGWSLSDVQGGSIDNLRESISSQITYHTQAVEDSIKSVEKDFITMPHARNYSYKNSTEIQSKIMPQIKEFEIRSDHKFNEAIKSGSYKTSWFEQMLGTKVIQKSENTSYIYRGSASGEGRTNDNIELSKERGQIVAAATGHAGEIHSSIDNLSNNDTLQLESYAKGLSITTNDLIRQYNRGIHFSPEIDSFLDDNFAKKRGVSIEKTTQIQQTWQGEISVPILPIGLIVGAGIFGMRKKIKSLGGSLKKGAIKATSWIKGLLSKRGPAQGTASDATERLKENIAEIHETREKRNTEPIIVARETARYSSGKRYSSPQENSAGNALDRLKKSDDQEGVNPPVTANQEERNETRDGENKDGTTQDEPSTNEPTNVVPITKKAETPEPYRQERWRPNARRAISAFDAILENNTQSNNIELSSKETEDLRELMKKESWNKLEYDIRNIVRHLRNSGTTYKNTNAHTFLEELDTFADDIAKRERYGRGYLSHTMSPYFVQKDINSMRSDPIAERIKNISKFAPTAKFDIGNGDYIYLSNRVRAADGAKNDHIALYALHEGKLTGYVFEESRTTGEWKLLPSKQWKHSDTLEQITTQHAIHATKSLGSLTIHTLNPAIITEIFKQPLVSSMPRNEIMHILHTPGPNMESIAEAA